MSIKYPYTSFVLSKPEAGQSFVWRPALTVVLHENHRKSAPIRSLVDTGSDRCIFDGQIGESLGLRVRDGQEYSFGGVVGAVATGYFHKVRMQLGGSSYETTVVFCYELSVGGILGQLGFFDHFVATFDWTPNPPVFELERIPQN